MSRATIMQLAHGAKVVAAELGVEQGFYCYGGVIAVPIGNGWSLAISADYAERLRIEACLDGRVVATMWCVAGNDDRLAELVTLGRDEAVAIAA